MSNNLNDISKIYLDQIANINKKDIDKDVERWTQKEQVGAKSLVMTGQYMKPAIQQEKQKKKLKESFSNWRTDLAEVIDTPTTDVEDLKKVDVKKGIKNKVVINPKLTEAIDEIGGELLEVTEYDPIDDAIEYLYEEGINEEGIDLLIEELGLEGFVEFIEGSAIELNEERKARRANVKAKSYAQVKKEVDAADAARKKSKKGEYSAAYKKKETDVTVYDDKPAAKKKAPAKKPVAKKAATVKKVAKPKGGAIVKAKSTAIVKAVSKVKKTQPTKKATKQGLGDKIRSAYKKGVERHKASVGKAKTEVGKVVKTAKATAKQHSKHRKDFVSGISPTAREKKIAKGVGGAVKKALTKEELELLEKVKGQDTEMRKAASADRRSGERISKKEAPSRTKNYVARTKQSIKWHDKRTKGRYAPGEITDTNEEVGISSAAAIEKAKKEAKLQKKEAEAVKKVKKEEVNPIVARNDRLNRERAMKAAKEREAKKPSADVIAARKRQYSGKNYTVADKKKVIQSYQEDKAFQNVVAALRKKHGEGSVITKDSPKPKSKPLNAKQIWRKDDRDAVQREVDAQYGRTPWNKKGSLGT